MFHSSKQKSSTQVLFMRSSTSFTIFIASDLAQQVKQSATVVSLQIPNFTTLLKLQRNIMYSGKPEQFTQGELWTMWFTTRSYWWAKNMWIWRREPWKWSYELWSIICFYTTNSHIFPSCNRIFCAPTYELRDWSVVCLSLIGPCLNQMSETY